MTNAITQLRPAGQMGLPLDAPDGKQPSVAETQLGPVAAAPAEQIERRWPADRPVVIQTFFDRRSGRE